MHQVRARINLAALKHNLAEVKKLSPKSRIVSVIKANAYGHGIVQVAEALDDSDAFAVARMDEALVLREHKISKPVFLLEGVYGPQCYALCEQHDLIPAIHCLEQYQWLQDFFDKPDDDHSDKDSDSQLNYWLKLDTGMHRLGLLAEQLQALLSAIEQQPQNRRPAGIMSHFASADERSNPFNRQQLEQFETLSSCSFELQRSMANSAAIMSLPKSHFDWVRPGIMLYGVSPFGDHCGHIDTVLQPVMTLEADLIAVKALKKGDCIGYGSSWCCPEDMLVGVVGVGYGDGYPRHARPGTPVLIHGLEVALIGRVSMDMITIDLQTLYQNSVTPAIGDKVTLWGEGLPVELIAQYSDTIAYELLCQITRRVTLEYE